MSDPDTQQGPPPPPKPTSGSPFGRFLTSPILLVGVVALVVGFSTFRYVSGDGGNPGDAGPASPGIAGSWETLPGAGAEEPVVQLALERSGGTMAFGGCTGELTRRDDGVYAYEDTSGERGCPRRMRVRVTLVDRDTLELDSRAVSGTLRRR